MFAVSYQMLIFVVLLVGGSIFQSVVLFRALLTATGQVRSDYLDLALTQAKSFETTLEHIKQTQHVQGVPLQLALSQHEAQRDAALADAKLQFELAKADIARRTTAQTTKPRAVNAMGD